MFQTIKERFNPSFCFYYKCSCFVERFSSENYYMCSAFSNHLLNVVFKFLNHNTLNIESYVNESPQDFSIAFLTIFFNDEHSNVSFVFI